MPALVPQLREGDRVVVHADPDGCGARPVFGVVNLPYTREDGSPGRTIEVVLETPVEVDDGFVRCIYTTAEHVRRVGDPAPGIAWLGGEPVSTRPSRDELRSEGLDPDTGVPVDPGVRTVDGHRLYSADWL